MSEMIEKNYKFNYVEKVEMECVALPDKNTWDPTPATTKPSKLHVCVCVPTA